MDKIGVTIRPFDFWPIKALDNRFELEYPGNQPAGIVFNIIVSHDAKKIKKEKFNAFDKSIRLIECNFGENEAITNILFEQNK
jgi:hypothetical protein